MIRFRGIVVFQRSYKNEDIKTSPENKAFMSWPSITQINNVEHATHNPHRHYEDIQTARQTNRETASWTDKKTGKQTDKQINWQTDGQTDKQTNMQADRQVEGQADRQSDRQADQSWG